LADLGVELVDLTLPRGIGGFRLAGENPGHPLDGLLLPAVDQRRVQAMLRRELRQDLFATNGFPRKLGLELGRMPLSLPRHRARPFIRANQD
jgi:hypothetical protein